jgi:hypothetical protein
MNLLAAKVEAPQIGRREQNGDFLESGSNGFD